MQTCKGDESILDEFEDFIQTGNFKNAPGLRACAAKDKQHKGLFISTAGLSWDNVFDAAFPAITAFFNGTGFEYYDNIIANRMDEHGGIKNHPTALAEACEKGQTVVRVLEKLKCEPISKKNDVGE